MAKVKDEFAEVEWPESAVVGIDGGAQLVDDGNAI